MWGANGWHMTGFGGIGGLAIAVLTIVAIVWVVRQLDRNARSDDGSSRPTEGKEDSAMKILRERYARGDIDADEFEERQRSLRSDAGG